MSALVAIAALALVKATPLIFAALAGVICERAGILNIALEGGLTAGAFAGVVATNASGNPCVGVAAGIVAGSLVCGTLGIAATRFGVDQIVAGIGINLVATGAAAFALVVLFHSPGASPEVRGFGPYGAAALVASAFVAALAMHVALGSTAWGLRLRACGENPHAVLAAGIDPRRIRVVATLIGGALAGLGGAYLSLGELDLYSDGMTAGRGYIALAAVIFGRWTPLGAFGAALGFGALSALQFVLQRTGIPSELMAALPYLAALAALSGVGGRARAPAADGVPFDG